MTIQRFSDPWLIRVLLSVTFILAGRVVGTSQVLSTNATALKYEEPRLLQGRIYSSDRKQLLFRFTRRATRSGQQLSVVREYSYPDGRIAARERVEYLGDQLRSFALGQLQSGEAGRVNLKSDSQAKSQGVIAFEYQKEPGSTAKTRNEELQPDTVVSDMVAPFLGSHWDALMRGEKVKCRYIVLARRETVGFTFVKESESTSQGKQVAIIKMEATSPIIAALIDPLFFTLEKQGRHHVLEYRGRTTPKTREGSSWKDLDAITVFDWAEKGEGP